jgi:acetyl-CoA carboxylase biotin carboxyl carrier protein
MDERPGELGGVERREQQQTREGGPQQHEPDARGTSGGRGRDDRSRRDPRQRRGGQGGGRERQQGGQGQQPRPEALLNMDELRELFDLFTAQGFTEFELEKESFRIRLRRDLSPQAGAAPQHLAPVPAQPQPAHVLPFVAPQQHSGQSAAHAEGQAAQPEGAAAKPEPAAAPADEAELHVITSPIVGTFYRAASPTSDPFVRAGSHVEPDSVVCIIEAMKLMNEIQAEVSGTVEKVYVENGQPVEYGQPLFGIKK